MAKKIFIDGKVGTTGLRIFERLADREDIILLTLSEEERKNLESRKKIINESDVTILCLPDVAAIEAVSLVENENTVIIDASTAHRTNKDWIYGFSQVEESQEKKLSEGKRIAVPGCHASGYIALIKPLIDQGIIPKNLPLSGISITGYSGGGKEMIHDYEGDSSETNQVRGCQKYQAPRHYALGQTHKHLKEIQAITGLVVTPILEPIVAPFYSGMLLTIGLYKEQLCEGYTLEDVKKVYQKQYHSELVQYVENLDDGGFLSADKMSGYDNMLITIHGNEDRFVLTALYDNLGKGASGAAVEALNMVLGVEQTRSLNIREFGI